jgi:hypothetical protein
MDAATLAIVTASLSLLSWTSQQYFARNEEKRRKKEELYRKLLDSILDVSALGDAAPLIVESQRMWLYASDEVLEAVYDYVKFFYDYVLNTFATDKNHEKLNAEISEKIAIISLAIRRDVRRSTKINREWIRSRYISMAVPKEAIAQYRNQTRSVRSD